MARQPRYILPGQPQHVTHRGHSRAAIFAGADDYQYYRACLEFACSRYGCELHAYVLMTNHVHLLMTPLTADGISKTMQSIGGRYARYFNTLYKRSGALCEGRYRATPIDSERYLFACYRYIELNPVRAGMVAAPGRYLWSSHRANAFGAPDGLVTPHVQYGALGTDDRSRQASYRAIFRHELAEPTLREIREATQKERALGDAPFRDAIAALDRRGHPLPKSGFNAPRSKGSDHIRISDQMPTGA